MDDIVEIYCEFCDESNSGNEPVIIELPTIVRQCFADFQKFDEILRKKS